MAAPIMAHPEFIQFSYGGKTYNIPRPEEFKPKIEDVYAAEITTCTGKTIADKIGWKFADLSLEWGGLPQDQLAVLANMPQQATMTFKAEDGKTYTEDIIRTSVAGAEHRWTDNGVVWWLSVALEVKFINVHN